MKQFNAIPVYPLRMRGRFGLTRHICRHGFWGAFFYTLLYALAALALTAVSLAPAAAGLFSSGMWQRLIESARAFFNSDLFHAPNSFFWAWNIPEDFVINGGSMVLSVLASLGLGLLSLGFYLFYLKPRYMGAMYNEMGGRIYGMSGSFFDIGKRCGACLRRYYTTYLALMLGKLGAKVVCSLTVHVLQLFLGALAFVAAAFTLLGGGLIGIAVMLLSLFLSLTVEALLILTFPVAVSEECKDFSALGRSLKLVWSNFWRVFGSLLVRSLYICLWALPGAILLCIAAFIGREQLPVLICGIAWLLLVKLYFVPFRIAFNTVLYHDALAREARPQGADHAPAPANAGNNDKENEAVISLPESLDGNADKEQASEEDPPSDNETESHAFDETESENAADTPEETKE